jgi:hypothetical protein
MNLLRKMSSSWSQPISGLPEIGNMKFASQLQLTCVADHPAIVVKGLDQPLARVMTVGGRQ